MRFVLKKLEMWNFKGKIHAVMEFPMKADIVGRNAAGKSTYKALFNWIFLDKDDLLNGNPNVFPNDGHECMPTGEATFEIDEVEMVLSKSQKRTFKEQKDGPVKITTTNSYVLNGVPKAWRDVQKDLEEKGIDFTRLEMLTNTDVFMRQKSADMRKELFGMVSEVSDTEVAEECKLTELAALLKNYSVFEIEAMKKAEKKKAEERLKTIPDLIAGMESAKVHPSAELYEQMNKLQAEIDELNNGWKE